MNKIVILDTNFLVSNTGKIKEIISLIEEKGNLVYVPKIVQEEYINIQLRKVKEQYKKIENPINIDEIRGKINELMWQFNYFIDEDWAGNTYEVKRYEIYEYMTRETTEQFLKNIPMIIEQNIFNKEIMVGNFFEKGIDVYQKGLGIKLEVMNEIYSIYKLVMKTEYEEPFINFVMKKINENVVSRSNYGNSDDDDLPF